MASPRTPRNFSFTVIAVALLASLRPDGCRVAEGVAGLLPALLGLASLAYPDVSSSLGLMWALAAITWGVGFVTATDLTREPKGPTLLDAQTPRRNRNAYSMRN